MAREVLKGISLHCITSHLNSLHLSLGQNSLFAHRTAISTVSPGLWHCVLPDVRGRRTEQCLPPRVTQKPPAEHSPAGPPRVPATTAGVPPALLPHRTLPAFGGFHSHIHPNARALPKAHTRLRPPAAGQTASRPSSKKRHKEGDSVLPGGASPRSTKAPLACFSPLDFN